MRKIKKLREKLKVKENPKKTKNKRKIKRNLNKKKEKKKREEVSETEEKLKKKGLKSLKNQEDFQMLNTPINQSQPNQLNQEKENKPYVKNAKYKLTQEPLEQEYSPHIGIWCNGAI